MNIFLFTLAGACLLAYLSEQRIQTEEGTTVRINKTYIVLLIVFLVVISGFRYMNYYLNDEYNYRVYVKHLTGRAFDLQDNTAGEWLYYALCWVCANIFKSDQAFIFIAALLTNVSIICFFVKYAYDFPLTVFMYIAGGAYFTSMNITRQYMALAILLWCFELAENQKLLRYALLVFLAAGLHSSAWIMLPLYFVFRKQKVDGSVFGMLVGTMIVFAAFTPIMTQLLSSGSVYDSYLKDILSGGYGVKLIRILAWLLPYLLFLLFYNKFGNSKLAKTQIFYCTLLSACISVISYKYVYIARFDTFFGVPALCAVSCVPHFFRGKSYKLIRLALIVLFFLFECYEMWSFSPYHNVLFERISGVLYL